MDSEEGRADEVPEIYQKARKARWERGVREAALDYELIQRVIEERRKAAGES